MDASLGEVTELVTGFESVDALEENFLVFGEQVLHKTTPEDDVGIHRQHAEYATVLRSRLPKEANLHSSSYLRHVEKVWNTPKTTGTDDGHVSTVWSQACRRIRKKHRIRVHHHVENVGETCESTRD